MPTTKYLIELNDDERDKMLEIISKGKASVRTILRANILLASDRRGKKPMTVQEVAAIYHTTPTTVQNVMMSYIKIGFEATLYRKKRETPPAPANVTEDVETRIIAWSTLLRRRATNHGR